MLRVGDSVVFSGSKYDEINGEHIVQSKIDETGTIFVNLYHRTYMMKTAYV